MKIYGNLHKPSAVTIYAPRPIKKSIRTYGRKEEENAIWRDIKPILLEAGIPTSVIRAFEHPAKSSGEDQMGYTIATGLDPIDNWEDFGDEALARLKVEQYLTASGILQDEGTNSPMIDKVMRVLKDRGLLATM